jgi:hypothetical protein
MWRPDQQRKQHWVGNEYYTALYDHINQALFSTDCISAEQFTHNQSRSSNNKGNSLELLVLHLWDQGENLLLFTLILTVIALNPATREWAPVGFPDFS